MVTRGCGRGPASLILLIPSTPRPLSGASPDLQSGHVTSSSALARKERRTRRRFAYPAVVQIDGPQVPGPRHQSAGPLCPDRRARARRHRSSLARPAKRRRRRNQRARPGRSHRRRSGRHRGWVGIRQLKQCDVRRCDVHTFGRAHVPTFGRATCHVRTCRRATYGRADVRRATC